jgi:predicted acyl esterase
LVVSPYDHGDGYDTETFVYPKGKRTEQFGAEYEVEWCDAVRGIGEFPVPRGKVSYYSLFENVWKSTEDFSAPKTLTLPLMGDTTTYTYDPADAPSFEGGLSTNFDGTTFQPRQNRQDVVTVYTAPLEQDVILKGKMTLHIPVSSDCEDTCFYARVSLETEKGDLGLRDDITTLCYQLGDYTPHSKVNLQFTFDEHALLIQKGQRLRVDLASADKTHYVRHTNCKGLFSTRTETKIARNTVYIPDAVLTLPIE